MENDLDKKLYNDYLNGEKEAFEILYNKYKKKIEYFIYNIVKDYQTAEDIAQETFIYVIQHQMRENSSFKYYIYLVARSKAINYINTEKRRKDITETFLKEDDEQIEKDVLDVITNEEIYRRTLWNHRPLTDFWRVGSGYSKKLEKNNLYTMGDIARCSINKEELLYKLFGINAELLIDHAWGYEPCTLKDIKSYKPNSNSLSSGQVLHCPYNYKQTKLIVKEMADLLVLDLVDKHLMTKQIVLTIGYDISNLDNNNLNYNGEITIDRYGRSVPKHAHGTINLKEYTSSTKEILEASIELYERIINKDLLVRRITIVANNVKSENEILKEKQYEQINLFNNLDDELKKEEHRLKENKLQHAIIDIKKKYGKNSILKAMNFEEAGTTIQRNAQIGGHSE